MIYMDKFHLVSGEQEEQYLHKLSKQTCYPTYYPFRLFPSKGLQDIEFSDITIFYGSNGSGKSTALNIIADMIEADRETVYNRTNFFENYLFYCKAEFRQIPDKSMIITSDGVFDGMLDVRNLNEGIDEQRAELFNEYWDYKRTQNSNLKGKNLLDEENFQKLKRLNRARKMSRSQYVNTHGVENIKEYSNGENAVKYLKDRITENGIFILDEPENSLAPERQKELVKYIEDAVRFFHCQFIISTHSPFFLALRDARIYDLDARPVCVKHWSQLKNIAEYYSFFSDHKYTMNRIWGGEQDNTNDHLQTLIETYPEMGNFIDTGIVNVKAARCILEQLSDEEMVEIFETLPVSNPLIRKKAASRHISERVRTTYMFDIPPDIKDKITRLEAENALLNANQNDVNDMVHDTYSKLEGLIEMLAYDHKGFWFHMEALVMYARKLEENKTMENE